MARRTLDYTVLTAPFDGFIEQRFVENHEEILTGQSVVRLVDPKDIEVNFMLPETSIPTTRHPEKDLCRIRFPRGKLFHDRGQRVYLFLERFGDTGDSTYYGQTVRPVSGKMYFQDFQV